MLFSNPCALCGAPDGVAPGQFCRDCAADLPLCPADICPGCGSQTGQLTVDACVHCGGRLPAYDACIAGCVYRYPVDQMIRKLKYQARLDLARALSRPLIEQIRLLGDARPDCLLPIPLHRARQRERGFNQAGVIARVLAQALSLPVVEHPARRHRPTAPQYALRPEQRERNVKNAFSLVETISYSRVAIVDDILTSGATANELARLLKRHGVEQVQVWCLARTIRAAPD